MRSARDSDQPHEPSEIAEAFHAADVRLDPPPGRYEDLRYRAAARRRRRVIAVTAAVVLSAGGTTVVAAMARSGGGEQPPVAAEPPAEERPTAPSDGPAVLPTDDTDRDGAGEPDPEPGGGESERESPPASDPADGTTGSAGTVCAADALELSVEDPNAGAGSVMYTLVFTNTGDTTCSMTGYPGVSLLTAEGGEQIGAPAVRGPEGGAAERVELAPGETARAGLRLARAENYPAPECGPAPAAGLLVYPPDETEALFLPQEGVTGCTDENVELLSVTVVS
ncbi:MULTISPECIES: DUF4232 domain-containing protein [Streptomyces]|uniref:DUF4232 domain-containing protein n=1 Tax=Streptomyces cheonanensis TaxID=312720 RepID=A0ABN2VF62_9ACTN